MSEHGPHGNGSPEHVHAYLLANADEAAAERLAALAALFDPVTERHLSTLGLAEGWQCWEIGTGGPSIPTWMAGQVGPSGRVLATDIDLSQAGRLAEYGPPVEVALHDVAADPPPGIAEFDLVHSRLVLVHVSDRVAALRTMTDSLRPGGYLVVEDADTSLQPLACLDATGPEEERANRVRVGFRGLMAARGVDHAYGHALPAQLRAAGLEDVRADAWFPVALPECNRLELATMAMIRHGIVEAGIATDRELDEHVAAVAAGRLDLSQPPLVSAWGRKPLPAVATTSGR